MRQVLGFAAAACAGVLAFAAPSQAATITVTFTGVIASGVDGAGIFGTPGGSVAGMNFTLVQVFEGDSYFTDPGGAFHAMSGGADLGTPTLVTQNTLTLGSHTYDSWAATARGSMFRTSTQIVTAAKQNLGGGLVNELRTEFIYSDPTFRPTDEEDADIAPQPFPPQNSYIKLGFNSGDNSSILNAVLAPTHWSSTLAVPEPSTWALLILGFGATGVALRSRREILAA